MSYEIQAIVAKDRLPSRAAWQAAINAEGFDVELFEKLDWSTTSGFFPCRYKTKKAGFELYRSTREEVLHNYPELEAKMKQADIAVVFVFFGREIEMASAVIASAVLVKLLSGVWFDPQEGEIVEATDVIEKARHVTAPIK